MEETIPYGVSVRVLFVGDSEEDTHLIAGELKKYGFNPYFERVETEKGFVSAIDRDTWDIILIDYNLPKLLFNSILKLYEKFNVNTPLILLTGGIAVEDVMEAIEQGVKDYIYKDDLTRLGPVITRELRSVKIKKEKKEWQKRLTVELEWKDFFNKLYRDYKSYPWGKFLSWALQEMIRLTESGFGFSMVISLEKKEVKFHVYESGEGCGFSSAQKCINDGAGLWFDPVRLKRPVVINEFEKFEGRRELPEGHVRIKRFLGVAAEKTGDDLCIVGVANKKEDYNEQDVKMLQIGADTVQKIVDLKNAEEALRVSEERYRSIIENASEGIYQSSPKGHFIMVNPALARIYGYESPEELIASIRDIGHDLYVDREERERFKEAIRKYGYVKDFEHKSYKKNGEVIWVSLNSRAVKDEKGNVICYEGIVEDITARKMAEESIREYTEKLRKNLIGTIQTISMIVEVRDPYTSGHQKRVSKLARVMAQEIGLSHDATENIRMAALIHDIGKISIPAEILSKPTRLSEIEMSLIKIHPQSGYDIVKNVDLPYPIAETILQHHERLDGSGYPKGIKNGEILLESQIIAIADVVEAISSHRPYRPALGIDAALEEIERQKGILFIPDLVDVCIRLFREKGFVFD
ncbi:MAG: PAS domain S-box protein [Syntrophorhabdaceae bacterium]|nr:PAS domain S-box protein [Syntrophorhabdaceae bacterium]